MVEGRTAWAVSEESHLTPVFELGDRWDGGKAETGVGIEARGRYLLAHQKLAFDEWEASLALRLDPGEDKREPGGAGCGAAPTYYAPTAK